MRKLVAIVVLVGCSAKKLPAPLPPTGAEAPKPPDVRLPTGAAPIGYRVSLELDPTLETFAGHVEIDATLSATTDLVWLNAQGLTIDRAVARSGGAETALRVVTEPRDFVGLRASAPLKTGAVTLILDYHGQQTTERSSGIVRQQEAGRWYLTTRFEPLGARRAVPCFDEPGYKVPWTLDLTVPEGQQALANEPIARIEQLQNGRRRFYFQPTPKLPSYLIAFAVGQFDAVDAGKTRGGAPIRIIVPKDRGAEAAYAAVETAKIVAALEDYTGIPYPFDKLDMLAIPNGNGGAMESPGLLTYSERLILIPANESQAARAEFVGTAAHGLGHVWFGDLVTMQWWDDLWLDEALATWISSKVAIETHPEMVGEMQQVLRRQRALESDSLASARKIRQPITSDADIEAAFDDITCAKGATVIRMFEEWLGEPVFQKGVHVYLQAHANGSATAVDFLHALDQASAKDVSGPFSTFLDHAGEPLITMRLSCTGDGPGRLELTQERFVARGSTGPDALWKIPVCIATGTTYRDGKRQCTLLDAKTGSIAIRHCSDWIEPLPGAIGYYRLSAALPVPPPATNPPERLAHFQDATALAFAGKAPIPDWLNGLARIDASRDAFLTAALAGVLDRLAPVVAGGDRDRLAKLVRHVLGRAASRVGWLPRTGESVGDARLRRIIMPTMAIYGADKAARRKAVEMARAWIRDPSAVPMSLWSPVLATAVEVAPDDMVPALTARAKDEKESRVLRPLYAALAHVRDPATYEHLLTTVLAAPAITGDLLALFAPPWRIDLQVDQFAYLREHWDALVAKTPTDFQDSLVPFVCDAAKRDDVVAFLRYKVAALPSVGTIRIAQQIEAIDRCIAENAALAPAVKALLEAPT